jgi:hypothetical protein
MRGSNGIVLASFLALGCGGQTGGSAAPEGGPEAAADGTVPDGSIGDEPTDGPSSDASADAQPTDGPAESDSTADGGTFACGTGFCQSTEVCVHPACGCLFQIEPMTDSGSCPDGAAFAALFDACAAKLTCQPPTCWSPNPSEMQLYCSGADASLSGMIDAVPAGSGHVCYGVCI